MSHSNSQRARARALLTLAPVVAFIVLFFLAPMVITLRQSVEDGVIASVLPQTAEASVDWDSQSPPSPAMQAALVADLRANSDPQVMGDLIRRLNSGQSGFRTLMNKTIKALEGDAPVDLAAIDKRWLEPAYWQAITTALDPITDRYLLAAMDYERDKDGQIQALPPETSSNAAILWRTLGIAAVVTVFCLILGYPYAMLLVATSGWVRALLLAAVLMPMWTSLLVRTAAWMILLSETGLVNSFLSSIGAISSPLALMFNRTGVLISMTHVLLPLMVLPLFSVLLTIPRGLHPAATSLGAHPLKAFFYVTLPLSLRGVASGALLVFMTAVGYYITPALMGGAKEQMISSVIAFYATGAANWSMASALAVVLLLITLVLYVIYLHLSKADESTAGKA